YAGMYIGVSTFTGGITNSGTINASDSEGITLYADSYFLGGITNSGTINSYDNGLQVETSSFVGNISNSGVINSNYTGAYISVSTYVGNIVNSGSIFSANETGIDLYATTFLGGITN